MGETACDPKARPADVLLETSQSETPSFDLSAKVSAGSEPIVSGRGLS